MHLLGRRLAWPSRFPPAPLAPHPLQRAGRGLGLLGPLSKDPVGLSLRYWLLDALRECVYLLLCCWCIKELLD